MWIALLLGSGGYVLIVGLVYIFQRRLQYFPTRLVPKLDGPDYEDLEEVELVSEDGLRLHAWYWPGERDITLVIFHGNAGNRSHRLLWIALLRTLGVGIFVLDYRGYGGSEGTPSEAGFYRDGRAAVRWLRERSEAGRLVYLGESIGSGVAVELAREEPPRAMIIQSGLTAAVDIAKRVYWYLPVAWLMKDRFESAAKIAEVRCPLLFIHGAQDDIVPVSSGRDLYERASEPREWLEIEAAGHNDLPFVEPRRYLRAIAGFLEAHIGPVQVG